MAKILNIETSTTVCSIAVGIDGALVSVNEINEGYSHAEQIELLIEKSLAEAGISVNELDAISVSKGPGSYTGLRIGVSISKGLCFGLKKPLISLPTLEAMAMHPNLGSYEKALKTPMLDARRMEVYACVIDSIHETVSSTKAVIIDENSFTEILANNEVVFFGPGMDKCQEVLAVHPNAKFVKGILPSARQMVKISEQKYVNSEFENVAYFEPFYLKDFVAGKPKKML